jgi:hypothetical protein
LCDNSSLYGYLYGYAGEKKGAYAPFFQVRYQGMPGGFGAPGALGIPGGLGMPGALGAPGGLGMPGAPGGVGMPGMPAAIAALSSSSVAPQEVHSVAVGGFFAPHFGQIMSALSAAGLKHINSPFKF